MSSAQNLLTQAQEHITRLSEIERQLADPHLYTDRKRHIAITKEHAHLKKIETTAATLQALIAEREETQQLASADVDQELADVAQQEVTLLNEKCIATQKALRLLLIPKDPHDDKNIILEIRAGTGGEEASLFVADLFRMYSRYAERVGWKMEIISRSSTGVGGFREVMCSLSGDTVYAIMKYENGVHRVQRIPTTESSGRLHTSAVTVAVLPEAEETDITIQNEDIRVDVYRSSGPGGQSVNTTDSAVRITHVPSGLVVICQDEKSQHKNKAKALRVLRSRLLEEEERKKRLERDSERRNIIGSGDRSERVRTYNFPQNRVSDHRISLTLYKLTQIMDGDLQECIDALRLYGETEERVAH